ADPRCALLLWRAPCVRFSFLQWYGDRRDLHSFLHDALPIWAEAGGLVRGDRLGGARREARRARRPGPVRDRGAREPGGHVQRARSEEHTSELQSRENLVCRLLLEKKKLGT